MAPRKPKKPEQPKVYDTLASDTQPQHTRGRAIDINGVSRNERRARPGASDFSRQTIAQMRKEIWAVGYAAMREGRVLRESSFEPQEDDE